MNTQSGFDFFELPFTSLALPPGTWTTEDAFEADEIDTRAITEIITLARSSLGNAPTCVMPLFEDGVRAAEVMMDELGCLGEDRNFRWHELRSVAMDLSAQALDEFMNLCRRESASAGGTRGVTWKVREQFNGNTFAVRVDGVGTLVLRNGRSWSAPQLAYEPRRHDDFFRDGYMDAMVSVELPYAVWGGCYAADKLAYSGKEIASVPTFRYGGREHVVTSVTSGSLRATDRAAYGQAWRLCHVSEWRGERYSYSALTQAVDDGIRERGDRRGTVVLVRGQQFVIDEATLVYDLNAAATWSAVHAAPALAA